ncbi:MAG: PilZ domain-containing protein [Thermodesulfobacteriota bacterium]
MPEDNRKFTRNATNVLVKYREVEGVDKQTKNALHGIAKNYSMGGIFLETDKPLNRGSLISLEFLLLDGENEIDIQAKAIVRWTQRFHNPQGMGLEFYEFTGLDGLDTEECLTKLLHL